MNEVVVKEKIRELCDAINRSPRAADNTPDDGLYVSQSAPRDATLEGHLDNLRLRVMYMVFDIEATRRENRYLRQMLESRPKPGTDDSAGDSGNG